MLGEGGHLSPQGTGRPPFAELPDVRPSPTSGRSILTVWVTLICLSWAAVFGLILVAVIVTEWVA